MIVSFRMDRKVSIMLQSRWLHESLFVFVLCFLCFVAPVSKRKRFLLCPAVPALSTPDSPAVSSYSLGYVWVCFYCCVISPLRLGGVLCRCVRHRVLHYTIGGVCGTGSDELVPPLRPRRRAGVFHLQRHDRSSLYHRPASFKAGTPAQICFAPLCRSVARRQDRLPIRSRRIIGNPFLVLLLELGDFVYPPAVHHPGRPDVFSRTRLQSTTGIAVTSATPPGYISGTGELQRGGRTCFPGRDCAPLLASQDVACCSVVRIQGSRALPGRRDVFPGRDSAQGRHAQRQGVPDRER